MDGAAAFNVGQGECLAAMDAVRWRYFPAPAQFGCTAGAGAFRGQSAAVLCADGSVYTGANIENASYGLTVCAERVAIFKAVSEGKRSFSAIAVCCGADKPENAVPCGACLQVMSEFFESDATIIACLPDRRYKEYGLSELFPHGFKLG